MNVEHINPFLEACSYVLSQFGIDTKISKPFLKNSHKLEHQVAVMIGVTGMLKGQVLFNMKSEVALKIASQMMGGMAISELDEISKSALLELTNMVLGNAATNLYSRGFSVDITPPSLMTGDNMTHSLKEQTISIPIEFSGGGEIEFDISVKEN